MNLFEINPYIRLATFSKLPPFHKIGPRIILDYELLFVKEGDMQLLYNDKTFEIKKGDIVFIRPGIHHKFLCGNKGLNQPHIHFDLFYTSKSEQRKICFKNFQNLTDSEKSLLQKDDFNSFPKNPILKIENKDEFLKLFFAVLESKNLLEQKSLFLKILDIIITDNFPEILKFNSRSLDICQNIKHLIDQGQCYKMDLSQIANQFGHDKYYLEKKFKNSFGIGIIAYRNQRRMEYAKKLLEFKSVTEVAEEIGFDSIYAFSRAFKNYYGVSPKNI